MNKALLAILSAAALAGAKRITSGSANSEHEAEKARRIERAYNLFKIKPVVDYTLQQIQSFGVATQAQGRPPEVQEQQLTPQELESHRKAIEAYNRKNELWKKNVFPVLVREHIVFNVTKDMLKITDEAWEMFSDAEKIGKVIHASTFYKLMGQGKKSPFHGKDYNAYDVIEYFSDPKKSKLHKGMYGRSRADRQTQKIMAQVQSKYSRMTQNTRHESIQYPNSVMSTIRCLETECLDENGDRIEEGILERTYASSQANVFPVGFINFIRCIFDTHYYAVNYDMLRKGDGSDWVTGLDDTYVFNPLTSEFGKVTTDWMFGVVQKMAFLEDTYFQMSTGNITTVGQSWLVKLHTLVSSVFSDEDIYKRVLTKWTSTPKGRSGLTRDGKMPLDLAKDIHMLVAGFLLRCLKEYDRVNLLEYILLNDIGAQNLSPFGACTFESYKETINSLLSGDCKPTYKLRKGTTDSLYTIDGYDTSKTFDVFYLDGLGYMVDLVINQGWSRLLKNCLLDEQVGEAVFINGPFAPIFGYERDDNELNISFGTARLSYKTQFDWKIDGDFFLNDFTIYFLGKKNENFRNTVNKSIHTSDVLGWLFKADNVFELKLASLENIQDKFLGFGHWLFETMTQLTRVIGSGQLELTQYLISPILDIAYLDRQAERYGVRPCEYPSHIIKKMEKQKEQAKKELKSPSTMYRQAVESMDKGLRKFFTAFIRACTKASNEDPQATQIFLSRSFRDCMAQAGLAASPDIDYGNPPPPKDPKKFIKFKIPLMPEGLAAAQGFEFLKPCWIYNAGTQKLNAKHFSVDELFTKKGLPRPQSAQEEWSALEAEYNKLVSEGYDLTVVDSVDQAAEKEYASLYQKDMMKHVVRLFKHLSRTYSVSTEVISKTSAVKIIGLVFGGQDLQSLVPNLFVNYMKNLMEPNTEIPTQAISYQGVKMVPTAMGINESDNQVLLTKIRDMADDTHGIIDLIADTLNASAVFGVPFTRKTGYIYGVDFKKMPSEMSEKLYFYSRNGLLSSRGLNVNPQKYINFSTANLLSIPESTFNEIQKGMMPSMLGIHRAQDIVLPLIQELMSKFTTSNTDDFGTKQVYMKVRTVGFHQLAVLSDDPLGFREMYRNLNKHQKEMAEITIDENKKLTLLNPAMLKYKDINSKLPEATKNACTEIEQDVLIKKLCDTKATINLTGKITYNTNNPLERAIIGMSLPFINHVMNKKTSLDRPSKEEVKEWEKKFDKLCSEMFAKIKKLNLLKDLYTYIIRTYKNPVMPVADFENMSEEQLIILLNRYKKFGPYQVLEGVNYPVQFMDLVQKQLDAQSELGLPQEPPTSYSQFDSAYKKAYDQSYVTLQSEKIGALLGILPGGYRIYMPYKGEHLRNIARATNSTQAFDTSPETVITAKDREAVKNRKHFSEIRSLVDTLSTSFGSHAAMCIGGSSYTGDIDHNERKKNDLHLVVVSPKGRLFFVMTISLKQGSPTHFRDFQALTANGKGQHSILGWAYRLPELKSEGAKERGEIASWVGRNLLIWLKEWMESPYMFSGNNQWPGADWYSMATSATSNWKNSKLYKDLTDQVGPDQSFEDLVNLGCMYWFGSCTGTNKPGKSLAFYENNCGFWGGTLGDIDLLTQRYPKLAGLAVEKERRQRIEKLKREGKLQ